MFLFNYYIYSKLIKFLYTFETNKCKIKLKTILPKIIASNYDDEWIKQNTNGKKLLYKTYNRETLLQSVPSFTCYISTCDLYTIYKKQNITFSAK